MISKEQIAHDLTIVYMKNRYGITVTGDLYISENSGTGTIQTEHFPDVSEPEYTKIKTGEKGLFGLERKQKVQSVNKVDPLFAEMVKNYYDAYSHFMVCCANGTQKQRNRWSSNVTSIKKS